jgi:hypothetical protein
VSSDEWRQKLDELKGKSAKDSKLETLKSTNQSIYLKDIIKRYGGDSTWAKELDVGIVDDFKSKTSGQSFGMHPEAAKIIEMQDQEDAY